MPCFPASQDERGWGCGEEGEAHASLALRDWTGWAKVESSACRTQIGCMRAANQACRSQARSKTPVRPIVAAHRPKQSQVCLSHTGSSAGVGAAPPCGQVCFDGRRRSAAANAAACIPAFAVPSPDHTLSLIPELVRGLLCCYSLSFSPPLRLHAFRAGLHCSSNCLPASAQLSRTVQRQQGCIKRQDGWGALFWTWGEHAGSCKMQAACSHKAPSAGATGSRMFACAFLLLSHRQE